MNRFNPQVELLEDNAELKELSLQYTFHVKIKTLGDDPAKDIGPVRVSLVLKQEEYKEQEVSSVPWNVQILRDGTHKDKIEIIDEDSFVNYAKSFIRNHSVNKEEIARQLYLKLYITTTDGEVQRKLYIHPTKESSDKISSYLEQISAR